MNAQKTISICLVLLLFLSVILFHVGRRVGNGEGYDLGYADGVSYVEEINEVEALADSCEKAGGTITAIGCAWFGDYSKQAVSWVCEEGVCYGVKPSPLTDTKKKEEGK